MGNSIVSVPDHCLFIFFEQIFSPDFDHKNVSAVLSIYRVFGKG